MELDKLDTTSQQCFLKGTLCWKKICSKGLEGSICSIGWTYFSAMSPERDVALEDDLFKRFGRFNTFKRLGDTVSLNG
jgi:hypothetical protein